MTTSGDRLPIDDEAARTLQSDRGAEDAEFQRSTEDPPLADPAGSATHDVDGA